MTQLARRILQKSEFYLSLVLIVLFIFIHIRSNEFFTASNFVDLARALVVPGMFALAQFLIILSGGIDVSFPMLATLSVYSTTTLMIRFKYQGNVLLIFILAAVIGCALGALNGILISKYKLPALIVTLGTASVFRGILFGAMDAAMITQLPKGMADFGRSSVFSVRSAAGLNSNMPVSIYLLIGTIVFIYFLMRRTMFGRGIYAIGGNETSAIRAGFNTRRIKFLIYCFSGIIVSIAGIARVSMIGQLETRGIDGMEMNTIAAVVLGGTSITGGKGTILGTMLGIVLIIVVQNSLILMGIPSYWRGCFTGMLIVVGVAVSGFRAAREKDKLPGLKDVEKTDNV